MAGRRSLAPATARGLDWDRSEPLDEDSMKPATYEDVLNAPEDDDARLDTLFLALPVSWKGTLVQYTGRLHRLHPGKTEVRIYDYVDGDVPMLLRMFERRLRGYRAIGYARGEAPLGFGEAREVEYEAEAMGESDALDFS